MANMLCPKCGKFQEKAEKCSSCGIIISKFKEEDDLKYSEATSQETIDVVSPIKKYIQSLSTGSGMLALLASAFVLLMLYFFGKLLPALVIALIVVFVFAVVLWPTKKAAEFLGAENTTYFSVILALVLTNVLIICIALFSVYVMPGAMIAFPIIALAVVGASYAKVLGTSFFRGIGIWLIGAIIAAIIAIILQVVVGIIGGVGLGLTSLLSPGKGKNETQANVQIIKGLAEDVCKCGTDSACMKEAKKELTVSIIGLAAKKNSLSDSEKEDIQKYSNRAAECIKNPTEYIPPKNEKPIEKIEKEPTLEKSETTTEIKPAIKKKEVPPEQKPVFGWRETDITNLSQLINKNVNIETARGSKRKGLLIAIDDGIATVKKSSSVSYPIPIDEIKKLEVYEQIK